MSNHDLEASVRDQLNGDASIDTSRIKIHANGADVILSGVVDTLHWRHAWIVAAFIWLGSVTRMKTIPGAAGAPAVRAAPPAVTGGTAAGRQTGAARIRTFALACSARRHLLSERRD